MINSDGKTAFIRYRWVPLAGEQSLTQDELKTKSPNFLFEELPQILSEGPIGFTLVAQVAELGDVTDDCTKIWPDDRPLIELGTLKIARVMEAKEAETCEKTVAFSPIPGVEGIEASADPILAARSAVYSRSSKSRHESER
jgi:catalase